MREMGLSKGKLFQPPHQVHFGLGDAELQQIEVQWPDGRVEYYRDQTANQLLTLESGQGVSR